MRSSAKVMSEANDSQTRDQLLNDLRLVGTHKLIGYLPLGTILSLCDKDPFKIADDAEIRGMHTRVFSQAQCGVLSGALYVFDVKNLNKFLSAHRDVLKRYQWPTHAHDFVLKIATETVSEKTQGPLYDLIALSFNDRRSKYFNRWREIFLVNEAA